MSKTTCRLGVLCLFIVSLVQGNQDTLTLDPIEIENINHMISKTVGQTIHSMESFQNLFNDGLDSTQDITKTELGLELLATASCQAFSLTGTQALQSTCASAVDYSFYIPAGYSLSFFEIKARSILNNTALTVLPNACQVALKKMVCSNIYLKCPTNIQLGNVSTYNYKIYSDVGLTVPLPFQRPCQSVCTDVNTKCLGLGSLLGLTQNCTARYDYSSGAVPYKPAQYDSHNDVSVCNAMTATFLIGSSKETYIGGTSGACYGIVDQLFIPPSSSVSSSLAPLQAPYVIQSIIEKALTTALSAIPAYLSDSCYLSLKKYICRSAMIRAGYRTIGDALADAGVTSQMLAALQATGLDFTSLLSYGINIPSYPSYTVCETYATECAAFIELANLEALTPNCSKATKSSAGLIYSYPKANQTILAMPVKLSSTLSLSVPFKSSPDTVSYATSSYHTACPKGFVVPDEPNDKRIEWVDGTGCAVECRAPLYTDNEFNYLNKIFAISSFLSIAFCSIYLAVWLLDKNKEQEVYPMLYSVFALILAVSTGSIAVQSDSSLCANNAVPLDNNDGFNGCALSSFVNLYALAGLAAAWSLQAFDLYLRFVLGKKTESMTKLCVACVVCGPLVYTIVHGVMQTWGYLAVGKICLYNNPASTRSLDLYVLFMPLMVLITFVAFCITNIVAKLYMTYLRQSYQVLPSNTAESISNDNSLTAQEMTTLPIEVMYYLIFIALWIALLVYRFTFYRNYYKYRNSLTSWGECAFSNFDGTTDDWQNTCGTHPDYRLSYSFSLFFYVFTGGQGFFTSIFYLTKYAVKFGSYGNKKSTGMNKDLNNSVSNVIKANKISQKVNVAPANEQL